MTAIFTLLVVVGFLAMFLSTFPVPNAARIGWGLWLAASIVWAIGNVGLRAG